jgi:hypothetical protein
MYHNVKECFEVNLYSNIGGAASDHAQEFDQPPALPTRGDQACIPSWRDREILHPDCKQQSNMHSLECPWVASAAAS